MKRLQTNASAIFLLSIWTPFGLRPEAAAADRAGPRIEVHFQDYAGVPNRLLRKAAAAAAHAFNPAGVAIEWLDCTAILRALPAPRDCDGELRSTLFVIQLVPEKMARAFPVRRSVFGYAPPGTPERFSNRAILFWDRIRDHCESNAVDADVLLGAALTHEIGHLLLGPGAHNSRGIMRCPWRKQDVLDAARGRLRFGAGELMLARKGAFARSLRDRSRTDDRTPRLAARHR